MTIKAAYSIAVKPQLSAVTIVERMPDIREYLSALHCTLRVAGPLFRDGNACLCEKQVFGVRSDGDVKACSMAA